MTDVKARNLGTMEVLELVPAISKRQFDYWRMAGAIRPVGGECEPGSGSRLEWSPRDVQRLRSIAALMTVLSDGADRRQLSTDIAHKLWTGLGSSDVVVLGDGDLVAINVTIGSPP